MNKLHKMTSRSLSLMFATAVIAGCANHSANIGFNVPLLPEAASGYEAKPGWATHKFAVAAANPLATDAGYQVLKAGGSAIDAAIAVQLVLGLVEPQSSGIAGGAFLLHYNGKLVEAFDGRETAPAAADEKLFLGADGKPLAFYEGVVGGRSVGTPGTIRMLEAAHSQHGKLAWAKLFEPAIKLADDGFKVSPRLATLIKVDPYIKRDPTAAAYFFGNNGKPVEIGSTLRNPAYAEVLRKIAREGSKGLLEGSVAQAIVTKVTTHPDNPGKLSMRDLAGYQAKKREPICIDYQAKPASGPETYRLCGMPPPSSGAIAVAQILGILNTTNANTLPLVAGSDPAKGMTPSADFLYLYMEASRLAFADRALYIGDPEFVHPPAGNWTSLIAPAYLAERARLIATGPEAQSMKTAKPGTPGLVHKAYASMPEQIEHGTSHISIVDSFGNAIAMTSTIEDQFGARIMTDGGTGKAGGFMLNNELTDFSFAPVDASGQLVANRVQPNKRPRSSMAPVLVFQKSVNGGNGPLVMSGGSPGGALIIHFTTKMLYGMLNWGLNAQQSIDLPNFGSLNGPSVLEQNRFTAFTVEALRARGAEVREQEMTSGLQAIQKTPHGFFGGADPRREGIVKGD